MVFIGEADDTWPQFLRDWERGCHKRRYEQQEKTDVTQLPLPRVDLLKSETIHVREHADLPRLPVHMRVLRHHRDLRPPSPSQNERASLGRA